MNYPFFNCFFQREAQKSASDGFMLNFLNVMYGLSEKITLDKVSFSDQSLNFCVVLLCYLELHFAAQINRRKKYFF